MCRSRRAAGQPRSTRPRLVCSSCHRTLIRLAAFDQRLNPEIKGLLHSVAADLTQDARSGDPYYTVRISIPDEELARLGGQKLVPGMPAEAAQ